MKVRIPLSGIRLTEPLIPSADLSGPDVPLVPSEPVTKSSSRDYLSGFHIQFGWRDAPLTGWTSNRSGYPSTAVNFNFPESDVSIVNAWFTGKYSGVSANPSDTLIKNVTSSVKSALISYFKAASGVNRFTSPMRIGWAFRYADGSRRMTGQMQLLTPQHRAPVVAVSSYVIQSDCVNSIVDIINLPRILTYSVPSVPEGFDWGNITHIDIVGATPVDLMPSDFKVTSVNTVEEYDIVYKAYRYTRPEAEAVAAQALIQNDLRIIASIPVDELLKDGVFTDVPVTPGGLAEWKMLPKYTVTPTGGSGGGNGEDPDNPDDPANGNGNDKWEPWIIRETEPLDLGYPEQRKWIRSVALRGCFQRDRINIQVYASRHRQNWTLVGYGNRGWVSGIARAGFRWWKVRFSGDMRRGDYIDAITFDIFHRRNTR